MTDDATQFAAQDELAEWAVEHAAELAKLDRRTDQPKATDGRTYEGAAA